MTRSVREELWRGTHDTAEETERLPLAEEGGRPLVPSVREIELGLAQPPDEDTTPLEAPSRPPRSAGSRVRALLSEYSPIRVTGGENVVPLLVICVVGFADALDASGLGVLLPYMREDLGFNLRFLLSMGALLEIFKKLLHPLAGYLADRLSRTKMAFAGVFGSGIASLMTAFAATRFQLGALRGAGGVVASLNEPTSHPLLADYYPPESRGRVFAFQSLVGQFGIIFGPLIGGGIAQLFGWRPAFFVLGGLSALAGVAFLFLKDPVRGRLDRLHAGAAEEAADTPPAPPPGAVESWRACASIVTLRRLWYAEPFLAIGGVGVYILVITYQADILPPAVLGLFAALNGVMGITGLAIGGPMVDRLLAFKPGRVLSMLGMLLIADIFLFVGLATIPFIPVVVLISVSLPFINSILQPARSALETLVIPARIRGFGLQAKAPWQLLGLLAFPLVGYVADTQSIQSAMLVFVPLFIVGAALYIAASAGVERDIRAARAADRAELEDRAARERGRAKVLVCRDVDVHYEGVQIVFGVDFDVEEGEIVALLGTNGAGKSTLLRAISGLTEASNGAIFLDGRDITHTPPYEIAARRLVQMPGGRGIFPTLTVEENLRAATWLSEDDPEFQEAQTRRILDGFFPLLRERLQQPAGSLSGGEQQMLALGQAFLMRPRLLMIDELSLGLAPAVIRQLVGILRELRDAGSTVILVEQSVSLALEIADRAIFMEKGEVRFSGPTAKLLERPDILRSVYLRSGAGGARPRAATVQDAADSVALGCRDVEISFGGIRALRGASLELRSGEIVGIIGPNGAGKTTLFDVISGFLLPDMGRVVLAGRDVTLLGPDERARLGLGRSFQDARLFGAMTVRDNILVALERHLEARNALLASVWAPRVRRSERKARGRVELLIETLGLGAYRDKFVSELSTGSRRIVDLACVMAADPEVLLLDEPSSGIAQAEAAELGPLLERVRRQTGCSMLVIEHDMGLITALADRLVAMNLGEVIVTGTPAEVVADPRVVESYLGAGGSGAGGSGGRSERSAAVHSATRPEDGNEARSERAPRHSGGSGGRSERSAAVHSATEPADGNEARSERAPRDKR